MAKRVTIERVLRDDDDASGQSVRGWKLSLDGKFITIRPARRDVSDFLLIQTDDVETLCRDLAVLMKAGDSE